MGQPELDILLQQKKKEMRQLNEVSNLTVELAQSLDRRDDVTTKMVLSMRQEPLLHLQESRNTLERWIQTLPVEKAIRVAELLNGEKAKTSEEEPVCAQIEANKRLLERIVALDERLSLRTGGKHSFYKKFR